MNNAVSSQSPPLKSEAHLCTPTWKVQPPRPAGHPSLQPPSGPAGLTSTRPRSPTARPRAQVQFPQAVRRARNRPVLSSLETIQGTMKRRSQRPGRPSVPVPQHSHQESAPHAPSPRRSRTITNYRRAQRAAGNHRLRQPWLQDMRSAAQNPVRRQWIGVDA